MQDNLKNILIIFPWWGDEENVGYYRVKRYVEALYASQYKITVVFPGKKNKFNENNWGKEIIVKNITENISQKLIKYSKKINSKILLYFWYGFHELFFLFDSYYPWAISLSLKNDLIKIINQTDLILSSSAPHSSHFAAFKFSNKYKIPHIVDMRDGWIDEPLPRHLQRKGIKYYLERRWEKKILRNAKLIIVTSEVWKTYLVNRYPEMSNKIRVITNSYPAIDFSEPHRITKAIEEIPVLLYTGRFRNSRLINKPDYLLFPLFQYLTGKKIKIKILLLSELNRREKPILENWSKRFTLIGCELIIRPQVSRNEMFNIIEDSKGLLLLSLGLGPIPSKLFEYIKSTKPILSITERNSAVWRLKEKIPQLFLYDFNQKEVDYNILEQFFNACITGNYKYEIPEEFEEKYTSQKFLEYISEIKLN